MRMAEKAARLMPNLTACTLAPYGKASEQYAFSNEISETIAEFPPHIGNFFAWSTLENNKDVSTADDG